MFTTSILPILSLASLFLSASSAPTRTETVCRCTIINTIKTWTTTIPSTLDSSTSNSDICASLGSHLKDTQAANPNQPTTEEPPAATSTTDDEPQPLSTTVLLQNTQNELAHLDMILPSAPTKRPQSIIVCYPEPEESTTAYTDSRTTIFALNVIVAMVILACIVEGYVLASNLLERRKTKTRTLRLSGAERLLRAPTRANLECIFSPGLEKKMRVYESPDWVTRSTPSDKRVATAYLVTVAEEEDDDEMSRPVM